MRKDLEIVILAAGKGSRMNTKVTKLLNKVKGKTLIDTIINKCKRINPKKINVIINNKLNFLKKKYKDIRFISQNNPKGTGQALKIFYKNKINKNKYIIILCGDAPLIKIQDIIKVYKKLKKNSVVILGAKINKNLSKGIIIKKQKKISSIKEYKNANKKEREITLCNTGVLGIESKLLFLSKKIKLNKIKNEYLITDIINIAYINKISIGLVETKNSLKSFGVNTTSELKKIN